MDIQRPSGACHTHRPRDTHPAGPIFPVAFPQKTRYPRVVITQEAP